PLLDSRRVDVRVDGAHFARGRELRVAGRDDGTRVTTHAHVGIVERNVRQRDAAAVRRAGGQVEPRLPFWKVIRKSVGGAHAGTTIPRYVPRDAGTRGEVPPLDVETRSA